MTNSPFRFGPLALTNTYTTNLLNPGTTTGGVNGAGSGSLYILLKHIRIIDKSGAGGTFRLYLGATGANVAGTEVVGNNTTVAANSAYDEYFNPGLLLKTTDFLVGGASAGTTLTIQGEGEIGVIP